MILNDSAKKKKIETQLRVTKQFLVVVVKTVICTMAPHLFSALLGLGAVDFKSKYLAYLWIFHSLNSGINWIIYSKTNPELRAAFAAIVPCCKANVASLQSQINVVRVQPQAIVANAQPEANVAHVQRQ